MAGEFYKLYCLDASGQIARPEWIEAANDEEALAKAAAFDWPGERELWLGSRKVGHIKADDARS